jgi:hypothetical protein
MTNVHIMANTVIEPPGTPPLSETSGISINGDSGCGGVATIANSEAAWNVVLIPGKVMGVNDAHIASTIFFCCGSHSHDHWHDNSYDDTDTWNGPWGYAQTTTQGDLYERTWNMITGLDCEPTIPALSGGGPNPDLWTCK